MNLTDLPWPDLAAYVAAVVGAGALSGLLAGIFGIGGGAVLVPVFYQVLGILGVDEAVRMHVSVATSLAIIAADLDPLLHQPPQARRGRHGSPEELPGPDPGGRRASLRSWLPTSSGQSLRGIFAVIALIVGLRLLFNRESWRLGTEIPGNPVRGIIGFGIGFLSTLMGIGGGVLNNTFMTLFGRPIHQAVATSAGVGALIAIPGMVGFIWAGWGDPLLPVGSIGFINWIGVLLVIPVALLTAPLGVRIAHGLKKRQLEVSFGLFCMLVAARFFLSL